MRLSHVTVRDDTLTHQVRFSNTRKGQTVSCNCRATPGRHAKAGKFWYPPMGVTKSIEESRDLYNNPENHYAPFKKEDEARW